MVVLINIFDVDPAHVETFLSIWKQVSAVMERRPGFIHTRFHRALAASRFVNVAEWESQQAFADSIARIDAAKLVETAPIINVICTVSEPIVSKNVDGLTVRSPDF